MDIIQFIRYDQYQNKGAFKLKILKKNLDFLAIDEKQIPLQPNGFLSIKANLTRTGVFIYYNKNDDGSVSIVRQLRLPEEVFAEKTLESLNGLPATNDHPAELVTTDNVSALVIGMTSDRPTKVTIPEVAIDGESQEDYVRQQITFFDKKAINEIQSDKKREFSLGYTCYLEESDGGEWKGQKYDYIQREIVYNHLSLVDAARGGTHCTVILDGNGEEKSIMIDGLSVGNSLKNKSPDKGAVMKKIVIDGKEFEVDDHVAEAFEKEAKKAALVDSLEAERDSLKSALTQKDSESEKTKQKQILDAQVSAKVSLLTKAKAIVGDSMDLLSLSDREIKEAVIKSATNFDCKEKSDAYVDARFDIVCDSNEHHLQNDAEKFIGNSALNQNDAEILDSNKARANARLRDSKLWQDENSK